MTTFTKTTAKDKLDTIRWASNDISACVGQEIANPLMAASFYKLWCLLDMLQTPSEFTVRKGAESLVDNIRENLGHLFDNYQTRLQAAGIPDMVSHMLNISNTALTCKELV